MSRSADGVRRSGIVFGVVSVLLLLEFWIHLLVPFVRGRVPFPLWPWSAMVELVLAALMAGIAAVRRPRLWWFVSGGALMSFGFLVYELAISR